MLVATHRTQAARPCDDHDNDGVGDDCGAVCSFMNAASRCDKMKTKFTLHTIYMDKKAENERKNSNDDNTYIRVYIRIRVK